MKSHLFALFLLAVLPLPLAGQTIPVRAGEHSSFTRIVVPINQDVAWQVTRKGKTVTLSFAPHKLEFNLTNVFDRIPKKRITNVYQTKSQSSVTLETSCECNVESFRANPTLVAIDIIDRDSRSGELSPNLPIIVDSHSTQETSKNAIDKLNDTNMENSPSPLSKMQNDLSLLKAPELSIQNFILNHLARASDQGLLKRMTKNNVAAEGKIGGAAEINGLENISQISAATTIDKEFLASEKIVEEEPEIPCISDHLLAIASWGNGESYITQISKLRSDMFEEFDKANMETLISMAKLQLHFGFGKEAEQTLALLPTTSNQKSILQSIARLVDNPMGSKSPMLGSRQHCDGFLSMWSLLSENVLAENANIDAILRSHATLPSHLRAHLGPHLSQLLAQSGEASAARSVISHVERSTKTYSPAIEMSKVILHEKMNQSDTAGKKLQKIATGNHPETPEALVKHVETVMRKPTGGILPGTPTLIAAFSKELEGSTLSKRLKNSEIKALALAGDFWGSVELLAERESQSSETEFSVLIHQTAPLFFDRADDIPFLIYTLKYADEIAKSPSINDKLRSASRALDLGFPKAAMTILKLQPNQEPTEALRLLRARASLAANDPGKALFELMGMRGAEEERLRTSALLKSENFSDAETLSNNLGGDSIASTRFLRSTEFRNSPKAQALLAEISQGLATSGTSAFHSGAPLHNARLLVKGSSFTRERVKTLMNAPEMAP